MKMINLSDFLSAMAIELSEGNTSPDSPVVVQVGDKVYVVDGVHMIGGGYEVDQGNTTPLMLTAIQAGEELSDERGECPCPTCVARRASLKPKKLNTKPKFH